MLVKNPFRFISACVVAVLALALTGMAFVAEGDLRTLLLTLAATAIASVVLFIVHVPKGDFIMGGLGIIFPLYYLIAQQISNLVDPKAKTVFTSFITSAPMLIEAGLLILVVVLAIRGVKGLPRYSLN